jgi:ATP-dependent Clp protease ATP-binding subunit ClpB
MALLRKTMRPEFLNRVDEIVMFKPLTKDQIREIVIMQLGGVEKLLQGYSIEFSVTEEAIDWLAVHGYDPQSGARPVKRMIQKEIINGLSKEIIGGSVSKEGGITVDVEDGRMVFRKS